MYGLISKILTQPGRRDDLAEVLMEGSSDMPGCTSYVVVRDPDDQDALWVTEVWESRDAHQASLQLPQVQLAMEHGRPLIAEFAERHETEPLGAPGHS